MKRKASAIWKGGLKGGSGSISTDSRVLTGALYSFSTRFENGMGTNPEELIAAAHAGCFSMALSAELEGAGHSPQSVATTATVTLEQTKDGFTITGIHLDVTAHVQGIDAQTFQKIADKAKNGCPVSRALRGPITMDAKLEG